MLGQAEIIRIPRSERRAGEKARKFGWEERQVLGKGGKGGMKTEYQPPGDILEIIHGFLRETPDFFQTGKDSDHQEVRRIASENGKRAGHFTSDEADDAVDDDRVYVDRYVEVYGAAGPGSINDNEWLIERVAFNQVELRNRIGVPARYLKIASVDGYSMEPFLFHGDQVFIDTRYTELKNDGVYAIIHDGGLRYKRVRVNFADRTVLLKSDNDGGMGPEILDEEQASRLQIVGKVIPFKFGHFKL